MCCGDCRNSRGFTENGVYCRKFGIMISGRHEGCRYHTEGQDEQIRQPEDLGERDHVRQQA